MLPLHSTWLERNIGLTRRLQIAIAVLFASSLLLTAYSLIAVSKNEIQSVVQIAVFNAKSELESWGSGTIIDKEGDILTNYHVIGPVIENEGYKALVLLTVDAKHPPVAGVRVKLVGYNTTFDLGLLRISEINTKDGWVDFAKFLDASKLAAPFVKLDRFASDEKVDLGATVQILGYPAVGGSSITYTKGSVSGFEDLDVQNVRLPHYVKTDAKVNPGNSGGSAFDDQNNFIGVPTFVAGGAGNIGYLISLPVINYFLNNTLGQPIEQNTYVCPDLVNGYLGSDNVCYCKQGFDWNKDKSTCIPASGTGAGTVIVPKGLDDAYCEKNVRANSVFNPSSGNCECKPGYVNANDECAAQSTFVGTPKSKTDLLNCAVVADTKTKTYWLQGHSAISTLPLKNKTCLLSENDAKSAKYRKVK